MWLIDQWAEQRILEAQNKGELDNLPGTGQKLVLDDDTHVPLDLRAGYRLLKNSGFLPPELLQRKEAVKLSELLQSLKPEQPEYAALKKQLLLLEMKLRQAGINTDFLRTSYGLSIEKKLAKE
ncbi:DnaJ family domain-containing protein [Atlantibacter sp.]|uniref:DnaJ family domain-containing protein n=1 Tax=Atlantibacter sp. TaxID=1903473 RepID=UPI0028AC26CD|nr:DnaJ family domain-containing protein [Atlantibacter sp.]